MERRRAIPTCYVLWQVCLLCIIMFKADVIDLVADKMNLTKKAAKECVDLVFDTITDVVAEGDTVVITGFGKFFPRERQERMGNNPQTGEKIHIPATRVPAFKAGKAFKEKVA